MSLKILKCLSSDTKWSALEPRAQSTNLLSSGSLCIIPHSKKVDCSVQFSRETISLMTLSATDEDVFKLSISSYSSKISLLTINSNFPYLKLSKIGRYLDFTGIEISKTLISRTIFIVQAFFADVLTSRTQSFRRSNYCLPKADPFQYQFFRKSNWQEASEYPLIHFLKHYRNTTSKVPFGDYSILLGWSGKYSFSVSFLQK